MTERLTDAELDDMAGWSTAQEDGMEHVHLAAAELRALRAENERLTAMYAEVLDIRPTRGELREQVAALRAVLRRALRGTA